MTSGAVPPEGSGIGPVEPGPPPGAGGSELGTDPDKKDGIGSDETAGIDSDETAGASPGAELEARAGGGVGGSRRDVGPPEPTPELENLWAWARGYIRRFGWAVAPVWLTADLVPGGLPGGVTVGCCCSDGEACTAWGKHLVSGLGVAHDEDEIRETWPTSHPQVLAGHVGIAVMTGSESGVVVLDVGSGSAITRARFKVTGHVLTQSTPSGGEHWLFGLSAGVAVYGGRRSIELGPGLTVLGDGTFVVVGPRPGYAWVGGADVLKTHGLTPLPNAIELALARERLIKPTKEIHPDDTWRTTPGNPLSAAGVGPRTYTRLGDVRRLVDEHGDKITFTPGLGYRVWTGTGWGDGELSMQALKSYASRLPERHRAEADELRGADKDSEAKAAEKWSRASSMKATGALLSDLEADDRILIPSATLWDAEGWVCGLPVVGGVGRLVNLRTGEIERDAITRRVSKQLGADYTEGPAGTLERLWWTGSRGGEGRYVVKYLSDLHAMYGPEFVRLLQRAAGASLYGRRGVDGDTDAVFVLKGPPRCGKSTFSEMMLAVSGMYGKAMNHNVLFGDRGNPEFSDAGLFGYRLLTFSEPPLGAPLNAPKLKALSGGDSLSGRLPYGRSEISFQPEVSLWLSTNHMLDTSDEAIWRRLKLFTFAHTWEGRAEMPELRRAVTQDPGELRLALAWMLAGATAWAREGWGSTELWGVAGSEERAKHDPLMRYVLESVVLTGSAADTFTAADALASFEYWAVASGSDKTGLSRTALRDEIEYALLKVGLHYDGLRKLFVGGTLA